jgi:hypothetical protein
MDYSHYGRSRRDEQSWESCHRFMNVQFLAIEAKYSTIDICLQNCGD